MQDIIARRGGRRLYLLCHMRDYLCDWVGANVSGQ